MAKEKNWDSVPSKFRKQSRKRAARIIRCYVLIVCEGTKTEPNYFQAFAHKNQGIFIYDVAVKGHGCDPTGVVKKAIELKNKNKNKYDRIWAVFDKDEFSAKKFNAAIEMGKNSGIEVAWSNEAFELWFLYHFQNVTTGVSRMQYETMISQAVNASPKYKLKKKYEYTKNAHDHFVVMTTYGSMDNAMRYAEDTHHQQTRHLGSNYAGQNPCTTVYVLVRQLIGKDEKLNKELIEKTNAR